MTRYAKTIVALIPAILAGLNVLYDALGDGAVSSQEWVALVVTTLTAVGVWAAPPVIPHPDQSARPDMSEQG